MAEEVVIQLWCDQCLSESPGDRSSGSTFRSNGLRVDLCPEHAKPVLAAQELFQKLGRVDSRSKPPLADPAGICPDCGGQYKPTGLGLHRKLAHGIEGATKNPGHRRTR